jgi:hypothetical protein
MKIISLLDIDKFGLSSSYVQNKVMQIFFLSSSKKEFRNDSEKDKFFNTWVMPYFNNYKNLFFIALNEKKEILGYLSGCINSLEFTKYSPHESYLLFSDLFENYNAHLHINCDPNSRGTGVGTKLINYYVDVLESYSDVKGVHIITGPKSRNVNFYQSNDFSFLEERVLNNYSYLFMGKAIFS